MELDNNRCLDVGGFLFILDPKTVVKLNSGLLNALINTSKIPAEGRQPTTLQIDADHECFYAFVQLARYESLPISVLTSKQKRDKLLEQATFWGIHSRVFSALSKAREEVNAAEPTREPIRTACRPHHNHRKEDSGEISFGTYCTLCHYSERKVVFLDGESYSQCIKCQKEILYKSALGWCHICRFCSDCQRDDVVPDKPDYSTVTQGISTLSLLSKLEDKVKALHDKV